MEIKSTDAARASIEEFTKRLLNLLGQKKELDLDIKALKEEFKEEGVPVQIVTGVINRIKSEKKQTDSEKFEADSIKEWLLSNPDIDNEIGALIAK